MKEKETYNPGKNAYTYITLLSKASYYITQTHGTYKAR